MRNVAVGLASRIKKSAVGQGSTSLAANTFGGNWTDDKLARLAKYLQAYRTSLYP